MSVTERDLAECPEMLRLRDELTKRGIDWRDDSEVIDVKRINQRHLMLRTKWDKDGMEVSVIWGYIADVPHPGRGITYGYPDMLECWYVPHDREPLAMTVEEILEVCA